MLFIINSHGWSWAVWKKQVLSKVFSKWLDDISIKVKSETKRRKNQSAAGDWYELLCFWQQTDSLEPGEKDYLTEIHPISPGRSDNTTGK